MIEERLVGPINSPEDREKLRRLGPAVLTAIVVLGTAIDAANGVLTVQGPLTGVVFGTPIAVSVVEYTRNVRLRRRFGLKVNENYGDGVLGSLFVILFTKSIMCAIIGIPLVILLAVVFVPIVAIGSMLFGISIPEEPLYLLIIFSAGVILSRFMPDFAEVEDDSESWASVEIERDQNTGSQLSAGTGGTEQSEEIEGNESRIEDIRDGYSSIEENVKQQRYEQAKEELTQIDSTLSKIGESEIKSEIKSEGAALRTRLLKSQAESQRREVTEAIDQGDFETAESRLESLRKTIDELVRVVDSDSGEWDATIERLEEDLAAAKTRSERKTVVQSQLNDAGNAIREGNLDAAEAVLDNAEQALHELHQFDEDSAAALQSQKEDLRNKIETQRTRKADKRVIGQLGSLGAAQSDIEDLLSNEQYQQAAERAEAALETLTEARRLDETHDLGRGDQIEKIGAEISSHKREAEELQSGSKKIRDAEEKITTVERAIQKNEYEAAETTLEELQTQMADLQQGTTSDDTVSELRATTSQLEQKLEEERAESRANGLLGSAMSAHSTATTLLEDGARERAARRLNSAQDSLDEAALLSEQYDLGLTDSINRKHAKVTTLLDKATKPPYAEIEEQVAKAEAAISDGIAAREANNMKAAVEAFETAQKAYNSARESATEHDIDAQWEIKQRASMVVEYLEVTREALDDRQQRVYDEIDQALSDTETLLSRAEQEREVGDAASARDSLDEAVSTLDNAAQLFETRLDTGELESRYEQLKARAESLDSTLPNERKSDYRNQDLINALQLLATKLGESPRPEFVNAYGNYSADAYLAAFGSWSEALAAANLNPINEDARARRKYDRTEVLDSLVELIDELGSVPSRTEMNEKGAVSSTTVTNRFADWDTAVELATSTQEEEQAVTEEDSNGTEDTGSGSEAAAEDQETGSSDEPLKQDDILTQIENELSDL